ncbi:hypothetical protein LY76DRAFT_596937, partial [Colletotrichum caudatum]
TRDGFACQQPCWPWPDIQKSAGWACPSPSILSIFDNTRLWPSLALEPLCLLGSLLQLL